jgi:hypothetical protein
VERVRPALDIGRVGHVHRSGPECFIAGIFPLHGLRALVLLARVSGFAQRGLRPNRQKQSRAGLVLQAHIAERDAMAAKLAEFEDSPQLAD